MDVPGFALREMLPPRCQLCGRMARRLRWIWETKPHTSINPGTRRRAARNTEGIVKSVEGIYRNGKVELLESLAEAEGSRVVVTWIHPAEPVDLRERGIDESQAADLRHRLAPFAEDWNRPEMAAYDELPAR